jgi:transposase-like protein
MNNTSIALPASAPSKSITRTQRTRVQWKSLVDDFTNSGLTKTAFCRKHGIATSCLYRWQKIFAGNSLASDFIDITGPIASTLPTPSLADTSPHWQVELELGAGIVLRVHTR